MSSLVPLQGSKRRSKPLTEVCNRCHILFDTLDNIYESEKIKLNSELINSVNFNFTRICYQDILPPIIERCIVLDQVNSDEDDIDYSDDYYYFKKKLLINKRLEEIIDIYKEYQMLKLTIENHTGGYPGGTIFTYQKRIKLFRAANKLIYHANKAVQAAQLAVKEAEEIVAIALLDQQFGKNTLNI